MRRSLSTALVLAYIFGMELWAPSFNREPYPTPDTIPIFRKVNKKIDGIVGQVVEGAEKRPDFREGLVQPVVSALSYNYY